MRKHYNIGDLVEWSEGRCQGFVVRLEGQYDEFSKAIINRDRIVLKLTKGKYDHNRFEQFNEHCMSITAIEKVIKRKSLIDDDLFVL